MTTSITLVRHGQSTGNALKFYTGQTDAELTELGRQQAELTALALAQESFTALYSSDLRRACATAEPLAARLGLTINTCARLREINLGDFHGESFAELARKYPQEYIAIMRRDADFVSPGGESHRAMRQRVVAAFQEIISQHSGGDILMVVHGGVIFHINHHIFGIPPELNHTVTYQIDNCSLNRYQLTEQASWQVLTLNDCAHLRILANNVAIASGPLEVHT
ncbi:MAG: histidine phosphatase family protein [Acidobacteriota bacterium]